VREARQLGHGNITRLLQTAEKSSRHGYEDATVIYETTLTPNTG